MFIAIDWGTARFRARLLDVDGVMLDMMEGAVKLSELGPKDIATQVSKFAQRWPSAKGPMLMAGMIGSSIGGFSCALSRNAGYYRKRLCP